MEFIYNSHFLDTAVGTLHFETLQKFEETKPFSVFIHGAHRELQNSLYWHPLTERIAKLFNPVYVDLLGHGKSDFVDKKERIEPNIQIIALLELISHLQTTYPIGPLTLFGRSYGGYLAMKITDELKHRINGLFLTAPAVGSEVISLLNNWDRPVFCYWDSKDPVINISNFSYIVSAIPKSKLYSIGQPASYNTFAIQHVFDRPDDAPPTHIPEVDFPDYFIQTASDFYDDVMSVYNA